MIFHLPGLLRKYGKVSFYCFRNYYIFFLLIKFCIKIDSYYGVNKPQSEAEVDQLCTCGDKNVKCGTEEDCLNRLMYTECPPACGDNCSNRRIQKHDWAPGIKRFLTHAKGYGVKTNEEIRKGEFILEYVGEVVSEAVFKERMNTIYVSFNFCSNHIISMLHLMMD